METNEEKFPAQWALDLLEPRPIDESNIITRYYLVPSFAASFGCTVPLVNYLRRRPLYVNSPFTVLGIITGCAFGYFVHYLGDVRLGRRDAVLRDYIMRHPERFPEPENRKYADIFMPWVPIR